MPRGIKKEHLPSKMCVVCNRPFTWRKVWERCWDEIQTCSDRCKSERRSQAAAAKRSEALAARIAALAAGDVVPGAIVVGLPAERKVATDTTEEPLR